MRYLFLLLFSGFSQFAFSQSFCNELSARLKEGNTEEAIQLAEKMDDVQDVSCINMIGEAYLKKGRNTLAKNYFEKALTLAENNPSEKADCLNNLGLVYWNMGNNHLSQDYLLQALAIRENIYSKNHEKTAASLNDLGLIMSSDHPSTALKYYEQALKIYQTLDGDHQEKIAQSKLNIGVIYRQIELYGDAINNFSDALNIWQTKYPEGHPNEGFVFINLGVTSSAMGFSADAIKYYDKALEVYLKSHGEKHPEVAYINYLKGSIHHGNEEFDKALSFYQKALISNSADFSETNIEKNPTLDHIYNTHTLLSTLYAKAQAFMDRSMYLTLSFNDLKASLELLYLCDELIDYLRVQATNEADKIALGNSASKVYETGALLCHYMANEAFSGEQYLEQSFYFAEKSKSAVLLEAIADASAKSYADIPDNLLEQEKQFTSGIAYYEQLLAKKPEEEKEKAYRSRLFELKQGYVAFVSSLERNYPKYFDLKYNVKVPGIPELQKVLDDKEVIISYFLTNASSRLLIYEIAKNDFDVHQVALTEEFHKNMNGLRNAIRYQVFDLFQTTSQELYKSLIPFSFSKNIQKIIIIPNDKLGTIPFDALLTKKSRADEGDYSSLPYLIKDYGISYQFSSSLFYQNKISGSQEDLQNAVFLCAPIYFNGVPDLPATGDEIEQLDEIFTKKALLSKKYTESAANESIIKNQQLTSFRYFHFATHGYVDEANPELSRLLLFESEDSQEDGNLYSGEIYNLNLKAKLVTLSACETGLGKISKGEGIIGLSRAFTYAGAENILVSLWVVSDESTAQLMIKFYDNIQEDNYSLALREAQLKLISHEEYAKPYYWAPFILIGQ